MYISSSAGVLRCLELIAKQNYMVRSGLVKIIAKRYYFGMASMDRKSPEMSAQMLLHLGRLAHGDKRIAGLTPAQWTVLRYFASANRVSRTASAFASFHCTTRGTASQTIKSLVGGGYLERTRSERDGRSARLDLSRKGRAALAEDPFRTLIDAIDRLPPGLAARFGSVVERLAFDVSWARAAPTFGSCEQCCHLGQNFAVDGKISPYYCLCADEALAAEELNLLCVDFEAAQSRRSERLRR